ncbi:hypothetical protein TNCT_623141 [Trichonephila clavata]|uniref:Uncharacterized protein n=1 Tax=Trichonephila clavata TaxID=2740835 RepID=A0A8X6GH29_TRICU|nr:hypothetical protein TNCT_623141 [Trichonephila clavata]
MFKTFSFSPRNFQGYGTKIKLNYCTSGARDKPNPPKWTPIQNSRVYLKVWPLSEGYQIRTFFSKRLDLFVSAENGVTPFFLCFLDLFSQLKSLRQPGDKDERVDF